MKTTILHLCRFLLYVILLVNPMNVSSDTLAPIIPKNQLITNSASSQQTNSVSRGASIEGRIVYPDYLGKIIPVADALVRIFPVTQFFPSNLTEIPINLQTQAAEYPPVRTSDNGFFSIKSIPCGRYYVIAFYQGFKTAMTVVAVNKNQDQQVNLMIYPVDNDKSGNLFGIVVEQIEKDSGFQLRRNLPVSNIDVQLFQIQPVSIVLFRSVKTNDQGRFYFADVPCGDYLLKIKHKDYAMFRKTITIAKGISNIFPIIKPFDISFEHANLAYRDYPFHAELIQFIHRMGEGSFSIGPYGNWHPDANFVKAVLKREKKAPDTKLTGFVYHVDIQDGKTTATPMPNIRILLRPIFPYPSLMTFPEFFAVSDQKGQFSFDHLPRDYHINGKLNFEANIQPKGFEPLKQHISLNPCTDNHHHFHLNAYGTLCQISGHVMTIKKLDSTDKEPVKNTTIQLLLFHPDNEMPVRRWVNVSDSSGQFKFTDIPPGEYQTTFNASGYEPLKIQLNISPGEIFQKDYLLTSYVGPSQLKGKVLNDAVQCKNETCEKGIAGAKVVLKSVYPSSQKPSNAQSYEVKTNSQGVYEFVDIQPGHYQIYVSINRFQPWEGLIKISKEAVHTRNIQLNPVIESANKKGYVVLKKPGCHRKDCQKPIKNARITLTQRYTSGTVIPIRTRTTGDGSFRFETIPAIPYMVHIEARGYDPYIREVQLSPGQNEITYHLSPSVECQDNSECLDNAFCAKNRGHCDRRGVCLKIPDMCPSVINPVCGCDGITYNNFCVAAVSKMSIAYHGTCFPSDQTAKLSGTVILNDGLKKQTIANAEIMLRREIKNAQVSPEFTSQSDTRGCFSFDRLPPGKYDLIAEGPNLKPLHMKIDISPNQKISKNIYLSGIEMNAKLTGIVKPDCGPDPCIPYLSGATVSLTHLLFDSLGNLSDDAFRTTQTDAQGMFTFDDLASGEYRIKVVLDKYLIYEEGFILKRNQKKSMRIFLEEIKSCFDHTGCLPIQYCQKKEQSCNQAGVCHKRPITCIMLYDPVCGCDGHTYNNACEAAIAGQNVDFKGRCVPDQ